MIYFISGHRNITKEEFETHYIPKINSALEDSKSEFVVGDYDGVDTIAQEFLIGKTDNVIVYHMFNEPMNNPGDFKTLGGFIGDIERDSAMTDTSDIDIAWVRFPGENSGTEQNVNRRK
jgi:CO dehydrogenase/acetyl-CoA synthase beta subunit